MKLPNIGLISIQLIAICSVVNTQRSSNGRHRTWWSSEEEPPQSSSVSNGLTMIADDLVINQNVQLKKESNLLNNNSIVVKLDDRSINLLTPEPLAAEIVKVDLSKSGMLLVSSSPTYLLTNQTASISEGDEETRKKDRNANEKTINFVQTKRMLNPNSASKHCLSTLDCDLELNERCLSPDSEEVHYYAQLAKRQPYTSVYSQYLNKKWKSFKMKLETETHSEPVCGCSSPSFIRNHVTGQCELMRVVELKFKLRTDRTARMAAPGHADSDTPSAASNNVEQASKKQQTNHQLKLDALAQIDHVIKNSDSLQDIVHHFRLTNLTPITAKHSQTMFVDGESVENSDENRLKRSASSTKTVRMQNQFVARGLLILFSSEYTVNFDLLFTNEYCTTQNRMRMKQQEKMFRQTLAATNQTWPTLHFNTIRSADFWYLFNNTLNEDVSENQSNRIKHSYHSKHRTRNENRPIEMPFIHHRKRREAPNDERFGLDVQLIEVNGDQINICTLNANYANEQLSEARRKYDLDEDEKLASNTNSTELDKRRKQFDYERRFFRLTYCDSSRAFCEPLPRSRAGYVCVCHGNLMDLSPIPELPGEYCGVKCPTNYCGAEGFCHVRNSVGTYPNPDHDLATQQRYLSTAGRMLSFLNGKLSNAKKDTNSSKLERETDSEQELAEYQSLIEAHKKNQTLLRQRYYAAIYSVQQRFTQLFENIPRSNLIDSKSSQPKKVQKAALATNNEQYKFDYTYSFAQTPQFVEFYCTCPGWTIGSRCQFSGWIILLVLGILVILLALITICTVSILCTPGKRNRRESTKSTKSAKSNLNTTSLTISDTSDTSDSLDMETSSQQLNGQSQHHHNQFNNPMNRQRRASEFVNDRRSSFGLATNRENKSDARPSFNIIQATPPHGAKETQKIQFVDTITEIPYDLPYEKQIVQISSQVQQQQPYNTGQRQIRRPSRIHLNQDRPLKRDHENERRFEFYDIPASADGHVYNTIDNQTDEQANDKQSRLNKKAIRTPISHEHHVYASAGELRVDSEEPQSPNDLQIERRSVGSQTSGFQSGDPSLAYLSAISLKQLQFDQQQQAHQLQKFNNKLPTTSVSGPIVWF